ncbi:MAG: hypothetical protein QM820_47275 [Minicystis sp.]
MLPLLLACSAPESEPIVWKSLPGGGSVTDGGPATANGGPSVSNGDDYVANGGTALGSDTAADPDHCVTSGALRDVRAYMADGHGAELVATGPLYGAHGAAAVQKLDASCAPVWTYHVPAGDTLWWFRLAVDAGGNVVVAGSLSASSETNADLRTGGALFVMKLGPSGQLLWRAASPLGGRLTRIVLAPAGDIVVSGRAQDTQSGARYDMVARYDAAGRQRWQKPFGDDHARVADLTVDDKGAVLVAGRFSAPFDFGGGLLSPVHTGSDTDTFDAFLAKYGESGNHTWSKRFGDAETQSLDRVTVDAAGSVTVRGRGNGTIDFGGGPLQLGEDGTFGAGFDRSGNYVWSAVDPAGG